MSRVTNLKPAPSTSRQLLASIIGVALACGRCGGSTDDRAAKWSFIAATIVEPSCATVNCHSAITAKAAVDLHDCQTGYYTLRNRNFVIPGDSGESEIVSLMNAQGTTRMPPDAPLSAADIVLIERWIDAGALDDCDD